MNPRIVVARGAASGLLLGAPAALINAFVSKQDSPSQGLLIGTYLVVLVSFVLAGFVAGLEAPDDANSSRLGITAALVTFAAVELIVVLGRLDRSAGIKPLGIALVGLFAVLGGNTGARLGAQRQAGRSGQ